MIIYSANIGKKDHFLQPREKHLGVEYVYFVEDKSGYNSDIWDVREVPLRFDNSRMDAKWYKMHPHLLFPGEDTIWVDGNYKPMDDPTRLVTDTIVLWEHASGRSCLYDEAAVCLNKNTGDPEQIRRQVQAYRGSGMPERFGLYQGNALIRKAEAAQFNEAWWDQTQLHSLRDQISMPYVLWRDSVQFTQLKHETKRPYFFKSGRHRFHGAGT